MKANLTKKVSSVFFILGISAFAEMFNNIILGRILPPEIFGRFKFINTVIVMLSTLLLFGQNMAIIRVFSKDSLRQYNWKKFISSCLFFTAIIAAIGCLLIGFFYNLFKEMIFAYFAIIAAVGIEYHSALLRAKEKYSSSMFLSKNNSIVFFLALATLLFFFKTFSFTGLLLIYTLIFITTFFVGVFFTNKFPCGQERLPAKTIKEGLWLFLISFSFTIMVQIDQFFIAKMLGYEKLADYVVIITVTRGFDLIAVALWFVLMPHYSKDYSRSIRKDSIKVGIVALFACAVYFLLGTPLLHLFFKGKYDHSAYLLVFFIAIGFFRVVYAIPSGIIGGRLPEKFLKFFLFTCVIGIFINLAGNYLLIPLLGLTGAAIATLVSWAFRVVSGYYIVFMQKKSTIVLPVIS